MHMYSLYVSRSGLFVLFDLASSKPLKHYSICEFRVSISRHLKVLRVVDFQRVICIFIPEASARNTICTSGWGWEFLRTAKREVPFIRWKKKSNTLTGNENRLCTDKIKRQRNQNQKLTSRARRKSIIDQQSCDWLFSPCILDPYSKILT